MHYLDADWNRGAWLDRRFQQYQPLTDEELAEVKRWQEFEEHHPRHAWITLCGVIAYFAGLFWVIFSRPL